MPSKTRIQTISFPEEEVYNQILIFAENRKIPFSTAALMLIKMGLGKLKYHRDESGQLWIMEKVSE